MKEKWRFIDSGNCDPSYNMALDEALLNWHSLGEIPPTVRFYGWNPATLTIGYFQKAHKEINFEMLKRYNLGFVRRPTGGRAVLHENELTYSVIVSEEYPDMPKTVTEAYRVISQGLLEGFIHLGLDAHFAIPKTGEEIHANESRSSACFDAPSWYELVVEGRKIAGSAQTRQKGVILQHGSILLDLDEDKLFNLFNYSNEKVKERAKRAFSKKAAAINAIAGRTVGLEEAKKAFRNGFERGLNVELEPYVLTSEEEQYVQQLAKSKYCSDEWNFSR
ncbi:lipoate--protein ligase family protein [Bacillus benzoevorans]|uniref:Octanoyltransferase LipM n=1 Tax=Bacillus benzoevorans TaxID=1456 RepID=A0A7X0LX45_9BACI|nr:biotin/lipoate A/B protein ligase family protein [Bacillus benzoevorans]MBB6446039.1 lipoate-protein ligase A [Bacillus benzoevorans]